MKLLASLLFAIFYLFISLSPQAESLTICTQNTPVPPYVSYENDKQGAGLMINMVKHAAENSDVSTKFIPLPWLRCQQAVSKGHINALIGMIKTEKRTQLLQFPTSDKHYLFLGNYYLFYAKKSPIANQLNSINKKNLNRVDFLKYGLGAPLGYVIWNQLKELDLLAPIQYDETEGLKMVNRNKIDGYVVERRIGQYWLNELGLTTNISLSKAPLLSQTWHMAVNKEFYKNNKALIDTMWQSFPELRKGFQPSH